MSARNEPERPANGSPVSELERPVDERTGAPSRGNEALRESAQQLTWEVAAMNQLQEFSARLLLARDLPGVFTEMLHAAVVLLGSDFGSTQLYDAETNSLTLVAHGGFKPEVADYYRTVTLADGSVCALAMQQGGRVVVEDVLADPGCERDHAITRVAGWRGVQSTPLIDRSGRLLGMLSTYYRQPRRPSERELRVLDLYVRQATDLIERIQAENALRRAEQELRDFVENASIGMHRVGPDGIILWANRTELDMLGYTHEEYVGHHISEFHADRHVIEDMLQRLSSGETLHECEARLRCKDGTIRHVLITSNVLWEEGKFLHTRCFTRDITQRKRAEEALRESEERFRALVNATSDVVYRMSPDWSEMRQLHGREFIDDTDEPSRTWLEKYIHPDDQRHVVEVIQEAIRTRSIFELEHRVIRVDGTLGWTFSRAIPILDASGEIVEWFGMASDVTRRKRAEEALRESEERFRTMADNIAQFAWMADGDGWIFWYNQRWFDYTGTTLEEMRGWGWKAVHHPDHVDRVAEKIARHWQSGEAWEDTFPLRGKDGRYRWFLSRAVPIRDESGRIVRWFGTNTDVTEQRQAQEALREADRRKDEFLATLAHELRNPLAPISNAVELMRLVGHDAARIEELREVMDRQVKQMVRLIDDLLDVSRISRGKINLKKQRIELWSVLASAVEAARPAIEEAGHELSIDETTEPLAVEADPARLAQVVTNLLNNAARYTPRGGHVRLTSERDAGEAVICVRDNGLGIPTGRLADIFEMFSQVDRSLETSQSGLGIGLTLVKTLVELHGGRVTAHSDGPGTGSEFVVRLPLAVLDETGSATIPPAHREPGRNGRFRVLVVEDSKPVADIFAMMLREMGHEVQVASSGEAALERARDFVPDVLFSDISMPRMNGYELAQRLRERPELSDVVLVAMTGYGQPEDRDRTLQAGFDHHLVKPAVIEDLQSLFDSLAERRTARAR